MEKLISICVLFFLLTTLSLADTYAVIVNKNMKNINKVQIKAIFLKKLVRVDGVKMVPLNLSARENLRKKFEKEVLHMGFSRLKAYWIKQHYLGNRPPLSMKSQESVKEFVKKVEGAIGYVDIAHIDDDVKVIYRWSD